MILPTLLCLVAGALPKIDILYPGYGTIFDKTCGNFVKNEDVSKELIAAAGKLRPEMEAEWAREGPRYMSAALEKVGAPFPYAEMQVVLTVCNVGTMSMPLMVNVRQYLPEAVRASPAGDFSEKVFHELMHHYVSPLTADSPLKRKYSGEPQVVLSHLHVMTLEKFVLVKLGYTSELKFLDQEYRTDPPPAYYKRAWEIVNDIEGPEPFIRELRAAARARR